MSILEAHNVTKNYTAGKVLVQALRGVNLNIPSKDFICIMGPSGSGKTTLLNLMGLLDIPSTGQLLFLGKPSHRLSYSQSAKLRAEYLGFIFQSFNLFPVLNAFENVEYPLRFLKLTPKERETRVLEALEEVGIREFSYHRPDELSGGQAQRVAIARAMITRPLLILADEPTANLDSKSAKRVMEAMQRLFAQHNTTFIFSTHDPRVTQHASRILQLSDGVIQGGDNQGTSLHIVEKHL
ncbi:MAG: ABC transporter ATP-binding protein [bacterium]|nr:ABC transporter ATP-binding protein [bacterium]